MLCPECGEDTNPTLKYCEFCNSPMEIDFERMGAALSYEDDEAVAERVDVKTLGLLYLSIYVLIVTVIVRVIIDRPVKVEHTPSYTVPTSLADDIKPRDKLKVKQVRLPLPK